MESLLRGILQRTDSVTLCRLWDALETLHLN